MQPQMKNTYITLCRHLFHKHHCADILAHSSLNIASVHWGLGNLFLFQPFSFLLHICLCALGSPACCISQFGPSFICWIGGLTLYSRILEYTDCLMCHSMIARCPGPVPATQARSISSPPLCWQLMFGFQMWHCALCPNMSIFLSAQNKPLLFSQLHWHEPQHLAGCRVWGVAFLFIFFIFLLRCSLLGWLPTVLKVF